MATKRDPGPFDCYAKLAPDEPYFLLRSTDELSPDLVESWADLYFDRKNEAGTFDDAAKAKYDEALAIAQAMRSWKRIEARKKEDGVR